MLVLPAGMAMAVMLPIMMVAAHGVRIILQPAGQQVGRRLVSVAGDAGIELNASLGQSGPGPTTNASTDQGVHQDFEGIQPGLRGRCQRR